MFMYIWVLGDEFNQHMHTASMYATDTAFEFAFDDKDRFTQNRHFTSSIFIIVAVVGFRLNF